MTEIGYFSLWMTLILSAYAIVAGINGAKSGRWLASAERTVLGVWVLLTLAVLILEWLLITRDFQVLYVAENVSSTLPLLYRMTGLWAGQGGSLLFWVWLLSIFSAIVIFQNKYRNRELIPYVISVLMSVAFFFSILLIFMANPFKRLSFPVADGQGLNPLLQYPAMVVHPPSLYLGYVGAAVPFAFAIAALITGRLGEEWIKTTRKWAIFTWFFLSLGNLFGAHWAYRVLGWGGYWGWDPVENAAFMPWLVGTAYLHSIMIQEKKDMLKVWNFILVIMTFLLTIFGTFLTRSGIISSVHSFTGSGIGPLFAAFLGIILIFSFGLLISRLESLKSRNELESIASREFTFLLNNLILLAGAFSVLWGTMFPMISEVVRGTKISVGPPFFNRVMIPIGLALLALTGICPLISWRKASPSNFKKNLAPPIVFSLITGIVLWIAGIRSPYALLSLILCALVFFTIVMEFFRGTLARRAMTQKGFVKSFFDLVTKNKRRYGGYIIHLGIVFTFVGFTGQAYNREKEATLKQGQSLQIKDYTLVYNGKSETADPHKDIVYATFALFKSGRKIGTLQPEKYFYRTQQQPTTEVAIRSSFKEDIYLVLAEYGEDFVTIKAYVNPLVSWVWVGGLVLIFGTVLIMWPDKRKASPVDRQLSMSQEKTFRAGAGTR